jgi:hypothetical protein
MFLCFCDVDGESSMDEVRELFGEGFGFELQQVDHPVESLFIHDGGVPPDRLVVLIVFLDLVDGPAVHPGFFRDILLVP